MKTILGVLVGFSVVAITALGTGCASDDGAKGEQTAGSSAASSEGCHEQNVKACMRDSAECAEPADPETEEFPTKAEIRECCERTAGNSCHESNDNYDAPPANGN